MAVPGGRGPAATRMTSSVRPTTVCESHSQETHTPGTGVLIVNADDWGRDSENTERTLECVRRGAVSSVSAMVFMEDSERAATVAGEQGVDAGLHLNLTTAFSAPCTPRQLIAHQEQVSRYLLRRRYAQVVFHPGLAGSFEYVVAAQLDEFRRIYQQEPRRLDGHHHMHQCANVLLGRLMPAGTIVRRNFSFQPGEKSLWNRLYRQGVDRMLTWRHSLVDYFFSLPPLDPRSRLQRIFSLAREFAVEVETHPVRSDEYAFLMGEEFQQLTADVSTPLHPAASSAPSPAHH
jgi:predicted glycoside hydrolase/deacetylase ChbG (UPF0249 family)